MHPDMKKIFITCLLFSAVFMACKKNYLDRLPSDNISEKEVFSSINNAEKFVNVIYNSLPNYTHGMAGPLSSATDETMQGVDWSQSTSDGNTFNKGAFSPSNFPFMDLWKDYYSRIRACNIFLQNFDIIPEDPNYDGRKSRLRGEVLALRAFYYFQLLKKWGGVPILENTINPFEKPDGIFYKRNSIDEVVAFIDKGLVEAGTLLPMGYNDRHNNWGRVSKMVTMAIRSRLLLYYASELYNPTQDKTRWEKAAEVSKAALDSALANGYGLYNNYETIFTQYFNQEVIWSRSLEQGLVDRESNPRGANGYAHSVVLQEMVDDYEMKATGKLPAEPGSGFVATRPFEGRDPRFYASVLYPGATWKGRILNPNGADAPGLGELATNYWQRKYCLESTNLFDGSGAVDQKWVLFRTAELYLNYAEAQNEANGPDNSVYDAIKAIRFRAGMPELPSGLLQDALREKIRHERRIELAFERHRFWDVRRWKIAAFKDKGPVHKVVVTVNNGIATYTYPVVQTRVFDPRKHYWMPIPQAEMDKVGSRNPDFKQNPGWE
jgi:hypothetical protein